MSFRLTDKNNFPGSVTQFCKKLTVKRLENIEKKSYYIAKLV